MVVWAVLLLILALAAVGYQLGKQRALAASSRSGQPLHSLPSYYGYYVALWCALPALALVTLWLVLEPRLVEALLVNALSAEQQSLSPAQLGLMLSDIRNLARGDVASQVADPMMLQAAAHYRHLLLVSRIALAVLGVALAIAGLTWARRKIVPRLRARNQVEAVIRGFLIASSTLAILTTVGIIFSLVFEAVRFFLRISPIDFLFGTEWSPQIALRAGQVAGSGLFGAIPLFVGTLLISFIALCVAMPVGLLSAIYMSEYAHRRVRAVIKPLLEILAGIPTVVYGFFAALTVAPFVRQTGEQVGLVISSESALAAGLVMGVMIIPFVSSLSDDVITAVPRAMREGSYGLGATQSETIMRVVIPAALPGIVGGFLLAASRAIGETMIVVMAAGLAANLTVNPLQAVTTVTVQIATLLVGDQEFDSSKTLAAFALGLVLFFVTLALNIIALRIVKAYREQYE
ncbi:phosphate ABC transporter permease subunit PstC [Defluviicoccus vanus]|uniref:Phosphate transport system permease protein n=1 Tax=Defluviicoccus vanus TaxID=111831 RepID=A0A7H1N1C5_9PROT|nr:phosphate ABC transporter permease subunit PstC [Defluviicoccus vanus]QNT69511.1 phosphate ABC transporter permease subunit PstC [Defluviicoccus vanus]